MPPKIDKNEIYRKLKSIFPSYTFDMSEYTNTNCKISSTCDKGHNSLQVVKNLLNGHGCNICSSKISSEKQKSNFKDVLNKFKEIHGDRYDYSDFNYSNNRTKSKIICPIHGVFTQSSYVHIKGHGCPSCSKNKKFTNDDFTSKSKEVHGDKFRYDDVNYKNMHTKVKIECPMHGYFEQIPLHHIKGVGCPKCNQSKGERMIEIFLKRNNIEYISQMKFDGCFYQNKLPFDFYLPKYNICIEFNGIQHYYPIDIFGGEESLRLTKIRDDIKFNFCEKNGIKLIIIKQDKKHIDISSVNDEINNILTIIDNSSLKNEKILTFTEYLKI
jgi:hypothetical protein